jgi:hypothetical protein
MSLEETLGNQKWMKENSGKVKNLLPETWTHIRNLSGLQIGFNLKLLGIDWRSEDEFGKCMVFFERTGLMKRDGLLVKRG